MPTYQKKRIGDQFGFEKPIEDIAAEVPEGGALKILDPVEYITDRQRRWYKGTALTHLVKHDENKNSKAWWDMRVKKLCDGLNLLKIEYKEWFDGTVTARLTTKDVGKKNMTQFIKEILAMSVEKNWGLVDPDPKLRK